MKGSASSVSQMASQMHFAVHCESVICQRYVLESYEKTIGWVFSSILSIANSIWDNLADTISGPSTYDKAILVSNEFIS